MAQPIDPNYQKLRSEAFHWDAKAPDGALRGIIMETGYDRGVVTFAAMSDSSVSIYFSWGGGMIGAGSHDRPAAAARNLAIGVARNMELFQKVSDTTPPKVGETKFFVLVDRDVLGAGAKEQELQSGKNKLAPIYHAAQAVMSEVRKLYEQIPTGPTAEKLMQGPIAQALALTCVGNAFLRGKAVAGFWPNASIFRFSKSCDFRKIEGEHDALIAADPMAWFETLRSCRGLQLHATARPRGPQQTIPISERESVGFVGGGPAWIIAAVGVEKSVGWQGHDRLGDRDDRQRKIWLHTYLQSADAAPETRTPTPLRDAARDLNKALVEIEAFANDVAPGWAETFGAARTILNAEKPDVGYHADIADFADFTKEQRQILGAVSAGWVFGGMGSWNDMAPLEARAADYERISEQLFRAMISAICALANSTFE